MIKKEGKILEKKKTNLRQTSKKNPNQGVLFCIYEFHY